MSLASSGLSDGRNTFTPTISGIVTETRYDFVALTLAIALMDTETMKISIKLVINVSFFISTPFFRRQKKIPRKIGSCV